MKIGILTLPFNNNFGGILQSFALQNYLIQRNHEVILIKRIPNRYNPNSLKSKIKWYLKKMLWINDQKENMNNNFLNFQNKYMTCSPIIEFNNDFSLINLNEFDLFVVGSDQVWRTNYTQDRALNYFFDFLEDDNIKRISYSASFGNDKFEKVEIIENVKKLLSKFTAISVRELSGVNLCQNLFNVEATHLLDPTFLISEKYYLSLIQYNFKVNSEFAVEYFLDKNNEKRDISNSICNTLKFNCIDANNKDISIENWLFYFAKCNYVITDSFHGVVFSIIFKKPFVVITNIERGATRFDSLLSTFNLHNRKIQTLNDLNNVEISFQMDNEFIDKKIYENILNSDLFLKNIGF